MPLLCYRSLLCICDKWYGKTILIINYIDVHMRDVKTAIGSLFKGSELMQSPTVSRTFGLVSIHKWTKYTEMKILLNTRRALAIIGYLPGERIFRFQIVHSIISLLLAILLNAFVATSVVFVVRHLQIGDIENSLQATFQVLGTIPLIASFVTIIYHKEKVRSVIDTLQEISNKCNWPFVSSNSLATKLWQFSQLCWTGEKEPSAVFFKRADMLSENCYKYLMVVFFGGYIVSSVAILAAGALFHLIRDGIVEPNHLFLPTKSSTPFNMSTFSGWACSYCFQSSFGLTYVLIIVSSVVFVVDIAFYFAACTQHFQMIFADLSRMADKNPKKQMRLNMKSSIVAAVDFHTTTKRCLNAQTNKSSVKQKIMFWIYFSIFELSRDILSGTICFQLLMNVVFMSITFFDLEMVWEPHPSNHQSLATGI